MKLWDEFLLKESEKKLKNERQKALKCMKWRPCSIMGDFIQVPSRCTHVTLGRGLAMENSCFWRGNNELKEI